MNGAASESEQQLGSLPGLEGVLESFATLAGRPMKAAGGRSRLDVTAGEQALLAWPSGDWTRARREHDLRAALQNSGGERSAGL